MPRQETRVVLNRIRKKRIGFGEMRLTPQGHIEQDVGVEKYLHPCCVYLSQIACALMSPSKPSFSSVIAGRFPQVLRKVRACFFFSSDGIWPYCS